MGSPKKNQSKGLFASMTSGLSMFGNAMHRSVNGYLHFFVILFSYNTPNYISEYVCIFLSTTYFLTRLCFYNAIRRSIWHFETLVIFSFFMLNILM
jgi:hypothetical protein